jgi:hypothetical protein
MFQKTVNNNQQINRLTLFNFHHHNLHNHDLSLTKG